MVRFSVVVRRATGVAVASVRPSQCVCPCTHVCRGLSNSRQCLLHVKRSNSQDIPFKDAPRGLQLELFPARAAGLKHTTSTVARRLSQLRDCLVTFGALRRVPPGRMFVDEDAGDNAWFRQERFTLSQQLRLPVMVNVPGASTRVCVGVCAYACVIFALSARSGTRRNEVRTIPTLTVAVHAFLCVYCDVTTHAPDDTI